jgi:hypothetical protein
MYPSGCGINHTWKLSKKSFVFLIVAMDETKNEINFYTFIH